MILSFKVGYVLFRNSTFSWYSSTALKLMSWIWIRYFVRAPPPGPTSTKFLKELFCNSQIIFRQIFSSLKKCWPRDFFRVYIQTKIPIYIQFVIYSYSKKVQVGSPNSFIK